MKTTILILLAVLPAFLLASCAVQEKLTKDQWAERYKPETVEEGNAMAVLQTKVIEAEAKAKTLATMNKFKIACAVGFVLSMIAFGIGLWLKMKLHAGLGIVGMMGCLAGYGLACADIVYGKHLAVIGLVYGVAIGGITIFAVIRALVEIIKGGEIFKKAAAVDLISVAQFKEAQGLVQSPITEKLVEKEIKRQNGKEENG